MDPEEARRCQHQHLLTVYKDLLTRLTPDELDAITRFYPSYWPTIDDRLRMSLCELELSVRATNCLECEDITTVGQLVLRTAYDLLGIRNFGQACLKEVQEKLQKHGLRLRGENA